MNTVIHNLIFHHFLWCLGALAITALGVLGVLWKWKYRMFLVLIVGLAYAIFVK